MLSPAQCLDLGTSPSQAWETAFTETVAREWPCQERDRGRTDRLGWVSQERDLKQRCGFSSEKHARGWQGGLLLPERWSSDLGVASFLTLVSSSARWPSQGLHWPCAQDTEQELLEAKLLLRLAGEEEGPASRSAPGRAAWLCCPHGLGLRLTL